MALYKYVVPERIDILKNASLRFSQPAALNDPFEMKPHFEVLAEDQTIKEVFYTNSELQQGFEIGCSMIEEVFTQLAHMFPDDDISQSALKKIKKELPPPELLKKEVQQNYPQIVEELLELMKNNMPLVKNVLFTKFGESIGVLSLTEKHDNILMWSHYANSYKGFVIEFDEKHEFFSQHRYPEKSFGGLRKVEYSDFRPKAHSLIDLTPREVFLIKSKQWEYEQEWRMLVSFEGVSGLGLDSKGKPILDDDGLPVCLLPIPPSCIIGVIFGSRMSDTNKNAVSKLLLKDARYSHVRKYQSILDEEAFKLNTTSLNS